MIGYDPARAGIDVLLELDGVTAEVGGGFWVSFSVSRVPPDGGRPHGIQYSLTLHAPGGKRVLGYDNAHAPKQRSNPSRRATKPLAFDHVHKSETKVLHYRFETPASLLEDFWSDVDAFLRKEGVQ